MICSACCMCVGSDLGGLGFCAHNTIISVTLSSDRHRERLGFVVFNVLNLHYIQELETKSNCFFSISSPMCMLHVLMRVLI